MTEMTRAASVPALAAEFDALLFASIGEERNGMPLSVVSALARLNVDPWQEARDLVQLPVTTADIPASNTAIPPTSSTSGQ